MDAGDPPGRVRHAFHRCEPGAPLRTERYFHPTFVPPTVAGAEQEKAARTSGSPTSSTTRSRAHMRADVTVGSFLSGGIDSTAIAALAKRYNPDLMTFTTGFDRDGFSEIDVAAESAAAIGVRHIVRKVSEEELTQTLPLIVWYLDEPVADPALVPLYFVANEARKHVKVVLSGEGADELFGGYNIYREPRVAGPDDRAARAAAQGPGRRRPGRCRTGFRGKDMLRRGAIDLEQRYYGNARIFREEQLPPVLRTLLPRPVVPRRHRSDLRPVPRAPTRSRGCSTSTCSPGCAATSWSRPTR